MIGIFLGEQNSGKTLSMTYWGYTYFKKGYDIYSNYNLNFPHIKLNIKEIEDYVKYRRQFSKAIFLIDEIYLFMDSRNFGSKRQKLLSYFLLQTSKRDVNLFASAQVFNTVEKRFRENCNFMVFCSRVLKFGNDDYRPIFDNMRFLIKNKNLYIKNIFMIKRVLEGIHTYFDRKIIYIKASYLFNKYDTKELINILEE